jgi:hypothetical protein
MFVLALIMMRDLGFTPALPFIARAGQLNTPADLDTGPPAKAKASSAEEVDA